MLMPLARTAMRRMLGRRAYLRQGYHVLIRATAESLPIGGAVVEASVTALASRRRFRAWVFEERTFLLDELIVGGQYLDELRRLRTRIESRSVDRSTYVLDCGANVGLFTLFAGTVLRTETVSVGFEPFEENRRLCEHNWRHGRHQVRSEALSDRDLAQVPLYIRSTTGATIVPGEPGADGSLSVPVASARLDALWPELGVPRVDVVKLDIEGSEEAALLGATETLSRYRPLILCSYEHENNDRTRIGQIVSDIDRDYSVHDDCGRRLLTFEAPGRV
jgi:FkbM family methyltransferase